MRKGFTVAELIVIISMLFVFGILIFSSGKDNEDRHRKLEQIQLIETDDFIKY